MWHLQRIVDHLDFKSMSSIMIDGPLKKVHYRMKMLNKFLLAQVGVKELSCFAPAGNRKVNMVSAIVHGVHLRE